MLFAAEPTRKAAGRTLRPFGQKHIITLRILQMAKRELLCYNCIKSGLQIGDDIVDVLSTDGKTDRALADASFRPSMNL